MTKIALCQMEVVAGRPDLNGTRMMDMMAEAAKNGARVVCFSEMCLPGYMIGDNWEDSAFVNDCIGWSHDLVSAAVEQGVTLIYGNVTSGFSMGPLGTQNYEDGRPLKHNSAVTCGAWTPTSVYSKTNLPNYREFEDKRYFHKGNGCPHPTFIDGSWATTSICEDGWHDDYQNNPIETAKLQVGDDVAHMHFNLSCSPYTKGKNGSRNRHFSEHSKGFSVLCYVNNVGIQNNGKDVFVFDGSTTVYREGKVLGALPPMQECIGYLEVSSLGAVLQEGPWLSEQKDPELYDVVSEGIRKFLGASGLKKVVIGLSGGIDSALSAMLHVRAIGKENVVLVNMPTEFNSETTKGIAKEIAKNLGCKYMTVPIGTLCGDLSNVLFSRVHAHGMEDSYKEDLENIAARMRGAGVQAALAAGLKAVFPNNGNKAEATVGYCTMAGDHMGYLAPIADLWKHEVYQMAKDLSDAMGGILPESIFTLKPSAELSAEHNVDEGKGDPINYWYHDKLFASWIEPWKRSNIEDTLAAYEDGTLLAKLGLSDKDAEFAKLFPDTLSFISDLERWWKLFKGIGVVKRVQSPPIIVLGRRAFGYDFREAIGTMAFTRKYLDRKKALLG